MARDLNDAWGWIQRLVRRVARLESGAMLENSSITNGRMRFIGGLLRLDSGALVELFGQWRFTGNGAVTGDVVAEGKWTQNGPWEFNGPGDIDGDVDLTGSLSVLGAGRVKVGSAMTLNPAGSNGRVEFANGAQVFTDAATIQVYKGNGVVQVSDTEAKVQVGGTAVRVQSGHVYMSGMATKTLASTPGAFVNALVYDGGEVKRVV